jgi:hypothetical protein
MVLLMAKCQTLGGWISMTLFELNEREKADVRARVAAVDGRYIQLGVLHPQEVADARYGGSEWSMELTLDPSLPRELPQALGQESSASWRA